ncbi:MAG: hypothetical protein JSU81_10190 [Candidatus Coatesbacteria bacterium]|nr:MAG: hypothetical protein JSU81_10190 [Candidatus Coatesbacteria bacterium]
MRRMLMGATLVALTVAGGAGAAMVEQSTAELLSRASLVITGEVEKVTSYPPDSDGIIYSEAEVRLRDTLVGSTVADRVTVRYMGGEDRGLILVVETEPTFAEGEGVLLFLAPAEGGAYECPDGAQGKFTLLDGTAFPGGKEVQSFINEIEAAASR